MELVLESKLIKNQNSNETSLSFYAVYSLRKNRIINTASTPNSELSPTSRRLSNTTVVQFLEREATINKDFSLTAVLSNVPISNETFLKENLAKKIEKGTLYASRNGSISTFNLGFSSDKDKDLKSICYYNLFRQKEEPNEEFLVCFILTNGNNNLDLFRIELDFYIQEIQENYFNKKNFIDYKEELERRLENWFHNGVLYLHRSLDILNEDSSILIEEAFSCGSLEFEGIEEDLVNDLKLFFVSFNCAQLILTSTLGSGSFNRRSNRTDNQLLTDHQNQAKSTSKLILKYSDSEKKKIFLSKNESSQFTSECARILLNNYKNESDPFYTKQILESYKLKLIQELNTFNTYLIKAQTHYYELYRVFLYLKYSKMSQTLINMYKNCAAEDLELMRAFNVAIEFYYKQLELTVQQLKDEKENKKIPNSNSELDLKLYNIFKEKIPNK